MALSPERRNSLQGCLSAFCDIALRKEQIWSPEQLFQLLETWIKSGEKAILPGDFQDQELARFCQHYLSQRLLDYSRHPVPLLIQDAQSHYNNKKVSDIRYGWDMKTGTGRKMAKSSLPPISTAFTVAHANQYISTSGPFRDLIKLLETTSRSHLERLFYQEWLLRYYAEDAPALIPEVHRFSTGKDRCGERSFTYCDDRGFPHKGRVDFLVYNARAGVAAFIELDGHASHKTVEQRQIDAMKRNVCAEAEVPLYVFTYQDIEHSMDSVMKRLDYLFCRSGAETKAHA